MPGRAHDIIAGIDASHLPHAYGLADDTDILLGLLGRPAERAAAFHYLHSSVLHQGTVWLATARITDAMVEVACCPEAAPVAVGLLEFVASVASSLQDCGLSGPDELTEYVSGDSEVKLAQVYEAYVAGREGDLFEDIDMATFMCAQAAVWVAQRRPAWAAALMPLTRGQPADIAAAAGQAVAACSVSMLAGLVTREAPQDGLVQAAERLLRAQAEPGEPVAARAAAVYQLGYSMFDVRDYLRDDSIPVQVAAALAPTLTDDPAASQVICEALLDPDKLDAGHGDVWGFLISKPSVDLIPRALAGNPPLPLLVDMGIASARSSWQLPADWAWGKYFAAIMSGHPRGAPLDDQRRRYLAALVAIPPLWDRANGISAAVFAQVHLPFDREACRNIVAGDPTP